MFGQPIEIPMLVVLLAAFLVGKPAGMYDMNDVLGISSEN